MPKPLTLDTLHASIRTAETKLEARPYAIVMGTRTLRYVELMVGPLVPQHPPVEGKRIEGIPVHDFDDVPDGEVVFYPNAEVFEAYLGARKQYASEDMVVNGIPLHKVASLALQSEVQQRSAIELLKRPRADGPDGWRDAFVRGGVL